MGPKIAKVIGPPGTGKTTFLLRQIVNDCNKYFPRDIGAVSYTNAAVEEIKARMMDTFQTGRKDMRNVGTIHSLCFHLLGLTRDQVADSPKNIRKWNDENPSYALSEKNMQDLRTALENRDYVDRHVNEKIFNAMQVLRNMMIPVSKWESAVADFYKKWSSWMKENGLTDFTGMFERVLEQGLVPDIKVLYADEQQDISRLGLEVLQMWASTTEKAVFIGDANQSIYRFAGAVPEAFIDLDADYETVLKQSYRVPKKILELSKGVIRQARVYQDAEYLPTPEDGRVERGMMHDINLDLPGSHMILTRCNYHLKPWIQMLYDNDILFHNPYRVGDRTWNPTRTNGFKALRAYSRILDGEAIPTGEAKIMVKEMKAKGIIPRGGKTEFQKYPDEKIDIFGFLGLGFADGWVDGKIPIQESFNIKGKNANRFATWFARDRSKFMETPRVIVGTIHSVKGGEADNVWLDCGVSPTILADIINEEGWARDDEARVTYVAVTRARKCLGLVHSRGCQNPFL